ncbi:MAG: hypothetical protein KJ667_03345 [Alphaproteobacteria bacterium]|nr:hypothetical protein [Alphaproteobacteria bacterium]
MKSRVKFSFNSAACGTNSSPSSELVFALRQDAAFATKKLADSITAHIGSNAASSPHSEKRVQDVLEGLYDRWLKKVTTAIAVCTDYAQYGFAPDECKDVSIHVYDSSVLSTQLKQQAKAMKLRGAGRHAPPNFLISLDELLEKEDENWGEVAFSRLFSIKGDTQYGYVARPGHDALDMQFRHIAMRLEALRAQHGANIPVVLLEDNVRHAKMLNWVIDLMEQHQVFKNAHIAGISTIFCCASDKERRAIKFRGKTVPLSVVADYKDSRFDVKTPRDLLFDGFVVDAGGKTARLPAIFMDTQKLFKIAPDKAAQFDRAIYQANFKFCKDVEEALGVEIPASWFNNVEALPHALAMKTIMRPQKLAR